MLYLVLFVLLLLAIFKIISRFLSKILFVSNLRKKAVLISGCDSGFGHQAALHFVDLGCHVIAGCLSEAGETKLRKSLPGATNLHICSLNVTSDLSVSKLKEKVIHILEAKGIKLWALINNAGVELINGPDDFFSLDHYAKHMDVNFYGTLRLTHAFKDLIKQSIGRIIFVTSIKGRFVFPECGPYTCSKWALEAYLDTVRRELADFGVKIVCIQPGGFTTNLISTVPANFRLAWKSTPENIKKDYGQEFYENRLSALESWSSDTQDSNLTAVAKAYAEAAFSKYPRYRYVIGWDCWLWPGYLWVSYLPETLQDFWARNFLMKGLTKPSF